MYRKQESQLWLQHGAGPFPLLRNSFCIPGPLATSIPGVTRRLPTKHIRNGCQHPHCPPVRLQSQPASCTLLPLLSSVFCQAPGFLPSWPLQTLPPFNARFYSSAHSPAPRLSVPWYLPASSSLQRGCMLLSLIRSIT